jgi:hypothetical protein
MGTVKFMNTVNHIDTQETPDTTRDHIPSGSESAAAGLVGVAGGPGLTESPSAAPGLGTHGASEAGDQARAGPIPDTRSSVGRDSL